MKGPRYMFQFEPYHSRAVRSITSGVVGILAFLINYGVVQGLLWIDGIDDTPADIPMWKFAGQTLYNAHWVDTNVSDLGQGVALNVIEGTSSGETGALQLHHEVTSTVPASIYHLVPLVTLLLAGYVLYRYDLVKMNGPGGAVIGAHVANGYFVATLWGLVLFEHSEGTLSARPDVVTAVVISGVLLPAAFGALGGVIAKLIERGLPLRWWI